MFTKRAKTGHVQSFSAEKDGAVICQACTRIVVSRVNLENGTGCPYCHHDVSDALQGSPLTEDDGEDIALPC